MAAAGCVEIGVDHIANAVDQPCGQREPDCQIVKLLRRGHEDGIAKTVHLDRDWRFLRNGPIDRVHAPVGTDPQKRPAYRCANNGVSGPVCHGDPSTRNRTWRD